MHKILHRCVGCDAEVLWNPLKDTHFECSCGSVVVYNVDTGRYYMPISAISGEWDGYIDDLVGTSDSTSDAKQTLVTMYRAMGYLWKEEEEQIEREERALQRATSCSHKHGNRSTYRQLTQEAVADIIRYNAIKQTISDGMIDSLLSAAKFN